MFVTIATREEIMTRKMKTKRYMLKHFKFPISISYLDPMENLPKAIELLLIDMKDNGIDRWNVEEITEEWDLGEPIPEGVDLTPREEFEI
jgi:hypothetical protein